ncbi:hypothetical protein [Ramlibacter tataouinensis]|uniref:Uncharacterized protein n=1 Tax=Ramlibacter tataouinensis (strain ATCC BAA-407 / DSM 14655 / LMG 21543 / TTB310) TaxID=365046 RepID=F5Y5L8_RAMTT|nr:hypothetical protein [Ramlibacter tataouinensis]AEG92714.1 hypothetical protein Rta_16220 [Ramlibacter tataouinensis TTB310]
MARSIGSAVESDLLATVAVLETLSHADSLEQQRLDRFETRVRAVAAERRWRSFVLAEGQGRVVFSTGAQPAAPGGAPVDPASMRQAIETRQPARQG